MPQLVGAVPVPLEPFEPGDPVALAALHFHDVGDRMRRPQIGRVDLDRLPPGWFGRAIVAALLKGEATTPEHRAVAGQLAAPLGRNALHGSQHVARPSGPEV